MRGWGQSLFVVLLVTGCAPPPIDQPNPLFRPDSGVTNSGADAGSDPRVQVRTVLDGDTIILTATADAKAPDGRNLSGATVRLLGVDAPEIARPPQQPNSDCWGDESRDKARNLMQGLTVTLEFGSNDYRDVYGRLLAYVVLPDGEVANEVLIETGAARSYERFQHRYRSRYEQLERAARDRNLGVWTCP